MGPDLENETIFNNFRIREDILIFLWFPATACMGNT
jgi:hypothetical protein